MAPHGTFRISVINGDMTFERGALLLGHYHATRLTGTEKVMDRLLGAVLTYADESFNTILELGFASSIRKEWEWRLSRGESTKNLEAFRGWLDRPAD